MRWGATRPPLKLTLIMPLPLMVTVFEMSADPMVCELPLPVKFKSALGA
jgi:hypothetical protein